MSRRAHRPAITYERPWSDTMLDLFDLVGADWTAPQTVRVRRTARGFTVTAHFTSPAGVAFKACARVRQQGGAWTQTSETLGFAITLKGAAA